MTTRQKSSLGQRLACLTNTSGSWPLHTNLTVRLHSTVEEAERACVNLCARCSNCNYVSFSDKHNDCSWFHHCDTTALLTGVRGFKTINAERKIHQHYIEHLRRLNFSKRSSYFIYTAPDNRSSLSLCVPFKSGSTTVLNSLYVAVTGKASRANVFDVSERPLAMIPRTSVSALPGMLHISIHRDPIDRLMSSFHSKVRCCPGTRRSCAADNRFGDRARASSLLRLNGNRSHVECLTLPEFTQQLERVHDNGNANLLDLHFRPQHLDCFYSRSDPASPRVPILSVDCAAMSPVFASLTGFGFKKTMAVQQLHTVDRSGYDGLDGASYSRLCKVVGAEYAALGRKLPEACAGPRAMQLSRYS